MGRSVILTQYRKYLVPKSQVWKDYQLQMSYEASDIKPLRPKALFMSLNPFLTCSLAMLHNAFISHPLCVWAGTTDLLWLWIRCWTCCSQVLAKSRRFRWFWLQGHPNLCEWYLQPSKEEGFNRECMWKHYTSQLQSLKASFYLE